MLKWRFQEGPGGTLTLYRGGERELGGTLAGIVLALAAASAFEPWLLVGPCVGVIAALRLGLLSRRRFVVDPRRRSVSVARRVFPSLRDTVVAEHTKIIKVWYRQEYPDRVHRALLGDKWDVGLVVEAEPRKVLFGKRGSTMSPPSRGLRLLSALGRAGAEPVAVELGDSLSCPVEERHPREA